MARTVQSEIKNARYTFAGGLAARRTSTTKDQRFVNLYQEVSDKTSETTSLVKRPGIVQHASFGVTGEGRGIFVFRSHIYAFVGNTLYKDGTSVLTLGTSTGTIGYTECTFEGTTYMFFCDGVGAWIIDSASTISQLQTTYIAWAASTVYTLDNYRRPTTSNNLYYEVTTAGTSNSTEPTWPTTIGTTVTDGTVVWTCRGYYGGFPSPHIPTPVYMNGYIAIPRANSADIYTCKADDPFSWNPADYITSEMFPDDIVALARQNNQIVAFGEYGTEFFYDNGINQLTGTPLARNANTFLQVGTPSAFSIGQSEQNCFFIGVSRTGGRAVWKLDGFNPVEISTPSVERILDEEGSTIVSAAGYLVRLAGHFFYVLCLSTRTLVYDIDLNFWHEWTTTTQSSFDSGQINGDDLNTLALNSGGISSIFNTTDFVWRHVTDTCSCANTGELYLLHKSNGTIGKFSVETYTDINSIIRCEINTPIIDFGNTNRKFLQRITMVGDITSDVVFVKWSDNDYQTWSSLKHLSMSNRPVLFSLGSFRRRAFNIYYTDNAPLRINGIDFVYSESDL